MEGKLQTADLPSVCSFSGLRRKLSYCLYVHALL